MIIVTKLFERDKALNRTGQWDIRENAARFTTISAADKFCREHKQFFGLIIDEDEYDD